jgi:hypothetical protein
MSPYTNFIAVEGIISRHADQNLNQQATPNLGAAGQQLQNIH